MGQIAVIDLNSETLETTVELGADGINPDNLMVEDGIIYTLNNKGFYRQFWSTYSPAVRYSCYCQPDEHLFRLRHFHLAGRVGVLPGNVRYFYQPF